MMKSMELIRLCKIEEEGAVDHLAALMSKFELIEWPKPEPEAVPEGHDGTNALTLGQMRTWLRDKYSAGMRVFIRPTSNKGVKHGIWLLLNLNGYLWYGDATDMIREMDWENLPDSKAKDQVERGAN